jgi:hypothetical protein
MLNRGPRRNRKITYLFDIEKRGRIVKKGQDDSNIRYWAGRSYRERMIELEQIRREVNLRLYGTRPEF